MSFCTSATDLVFPFLYFSRFAIFYHFASVGMKSSKSCSSSSGAPASNPPPEDISSGSESEVDSPERAQLNADIRQNRRLTRRSYRKFARLLSKCTPEKVGAELSADLKSMFGEANQQHLLSSDGGSSGDEEADLVFCPRLPKLPVGITGMTRMTRMTRALLQTLLSTIPCRCAEF